jgi:hypothetical protein
MAHGLLPCRLGAPATISRAAFGIPCAARRTANAVYFALQGERGLAHGKPKRADNRPTKNVLPPCD